MRKLFTDWISPQAFDLPLTVEDLSTIALPPTVSRPERLRNAMTAAREDFAQALEKKETALARLEAEIAELRDGLCRIEAFFQTGDEDQKGDDTATD